MHLHHSFFVAGLMVSSVCAGEQQELSGTFISDRDVAMVCLRSTGVYSPEQMAKIGSVMGKMKVVFTGDTAVSELDDHNTSGQFKIAEQGAGHIVILTNLAEEPVRNWI